MGERGRKGPEGGGAEDRGAGCCGQQRNRPLTLDREADGRERSGLRGCPGLLQPPGGRDRAAERADGVKAPEKGLQEDVGLRGESGPGRDPGVLTRPLARLFVRQAFV